MVRLTQIFEAQRWPCRGATAINGGMFSPVVDAISVPKVHGFYEVDIAHRRRNSGRRVTPALPALPAPQAPETHHILWPS